MRHVFISHSTGNKKTADSLCSWLESHGIRCWMAPRNISSGNYAGEITRALKAADIVLIICSRESCRSEHVKNEVTLAFNNAKHLIPYCLDENPFDDDLEYYLSSKQRITTCGDSKQDFALIERMIRDFRGEDSAEAASASIPRHKHKYLLPGIIAAMLILAVAGGVLFFLKGHQQSAEPNIAEPTEIPAASSDTTAVQQIPAESAEAAATKAPSASKPSSEVKTSGANSMTDSFTGKITDGFPDGAGRYTFKKARRIDMHDETGRMAQPGDYIDGVWTRGHLNYGEWYSADGTMKAFIQLGDNPDTEADHTLGICVRP